MTNLLQIKTERVTFFSNKRIFTRQLLNIGNRIYFLLMQAMVYIFL